MNMRIGWSHNKMAFTTSFVEGGALFLFLVVQWTIRSPHPKLNCYLSVLHRVNSLCVPLGVLAMAGRQTEKEKLYIYCYINKFVVYKYFEKEDQPPNETPEFVLNNLANNFRRKKFRRIYLYLLQVVYSN